MKEQEPYGLDVNFERSLITMLCHRPRFYARVGNHLNPELLGDDVTRIALKVAQAFAADAGNGPSSLQVIAQRMRRWLEEGKITQEHINDVMDMFDDAKEAGLPEEDDAIAEIVPVLQRRIHGKAVREAIETYGKRGDMSQIADMIQKSSRIGEATDSIGIEIGDDAFDEISRISQIPRLPTGIPDLDNALGTGFEQGSLFVFMGGAGDGKSLMLSQIAAETILKKKNVAYATLELSTARTTARIMSNISGVAINALLNGSQDIARQRINELRERGIGMLRVEYFTPGVTTIEDIRAFVNRVEDRTGEEIHVVIVDYDDRLTVPQPSRRGDYIDMREVFEGHRVWMEQEGRWGITASQATRRDKSRKKRHPLDGDDIADSTNKARVCDGLISINVQEEGREVVFYIAKNRNGVARQTVGPVFPDWACARISNAIDRPFDSKQRDELDEVDPQRTMFH